MCLYIYMYMCEHYSGYIPGHNVIALGSMYKQQATWNLWETNNIQGRLCREPAAFEETAYIELHTQ